MAKGLRSKVKKRWRSLKRAHVEEIKVKPEIKALSAKLIATTQNRGYRQPEPKNAFLYPNDPEATFPQYQPPPTIDFRSGNVPIAGTQFVGARREKKIKARTEVTTVVIGDEVEEEQQEDQVIQQLPGDNADDLAAALGGLDVRSKKQKQKENRKQGMGEEIKTEKRIGKNKNQSKRRRTEGYRNKFKGRQNQN